MILATPFYWKWDSTKIILITRFLKLIFLVQIINKILIFDMVHSTVDMNNIHKIIRVY